MPKAQRERRERTDNYHLILQWCRTPEQRLYEGIHAEIYTSLGYHLIKVAPEALSQRVHHITHAMRNECEIIRNFLP
jgi:hypothetical protein